MRIFRHHRHKLTWLGQASAWSALLLAMLLTWLSVDSTAHAWLHAGQTAGHDCDQASIPSHEDDCVIAQFAQSHVDSFGSPLLMVGPVVATIEKVQPLECVLVARACDLLPPGRGPPVS